jgi:hypothetical protein
MQLESRYYWAFSAKLHPALLSSLTSQTLPRERVAYPIQKPHIEALRIYRVTTIAGQPREPNCLFIALACTLDHIWLSQSLRSETSTEGQLLIEAPACSDNGLWLKDILSETPALQRCARPLGLTAYSAALIGALSHPQQKAHLLLCVTLQ